MERGMQPSTHWTHSEGGALGSALPLTVEPCPAQLIVTGADGFLGHRLAEYRVIFKRLERVVIGPGCAGVGDGIMGWMSASHGPVSYKQLQTLHKRSLMPVLRLWNRKLL
jgi:hypothetical protein